MVGAPQFLSVRAGGKALITLVGGSPSKFRYVPDSAHRIGATPKLARGPTHAAGRPTRKDTTLACGKEGAPSGADELGVELAKWYHAAA